MKKILVTTIALLSLAAASTMDARISKAAANSAATSDVKAATADLKAAPRSEKEQAAQDVIAALQQNPDMMELARLELERKKIIENMDLEKANNGWVFKSAKYKELQNELRGKQKEIAAIRKELPKTSTTVVYGAVAATVLAIGVTLALEYFYSAEGKAFTREGLVGTQLGKGRAAVGGLYGSAKQQYRKRMPVMLGGEERVNPAAM